MEITWRVIRREGEEWGEMVQGIRSINARYKIGGDEEWYRKWRSQRTYMYDPRT